MEQPVSQSRTAAMFSGQTSLGQILVVDDEPGVGKVVRLSLEKAGYDVIEKWRKPSLTGRDSHRHSNAQPEWACRNSVFSK